MASMPVRTLRLAAAATLSLVAAQAYGQDASAPASGLVSSPTAMDISGAYPKRALRDDLGGDVMLSCKMVRDTDGTGKPSDCVVESEGPRDYGFGLAAISVAQKLRYAASAVAAREAKPVEIAIRFGLGAPDRPVALKIPNLPRPEMPAPLRADRYRSRAVLDCILLSTTDRLGCDLVSEFPADLGVGAYALRLGNWYRYSPELEADRIGKRVLVMMDFNETAPPRPTPGAPQLCPAKRDCAVAN